MSLFTKSDLRQRVVERKQRDATFSTKSAQEILQERRKSAPPGTKFDIFLSHSYLDAELVLGLSLAFQALNYQVYVDWVVDSHLDRSNVSKETARLLRARMEDCKCLFFASTENTTTSKWMPWETGYFDAKKGKVAIVPIRDYTGWGDTYEGQEYLGLYPYISINQLQGSTAPVLFVNEDADTYVRFDSWLEGAKPFKRQK